MALGDVAVLDLLLTARYVGGPAFRSMESDIAGLVESSSMLEKAGRAFDVLGTAAIGAGIGIAAGLGYATQQAVGYDQSLQRIQATAGLTHPQVSNLSDLAMHLSDQWGISAQKIVDGSYFLISGVQALGYNYNDVINNQILPSFAAYVEASGAGKAGAVDFMQAAQDLPHVLAGMHVPIKQWSDALGQLTVVESQSGLSQSQLLSGMTRFVPQGGFLGMNFGQTAALVGALSTLGVAGSGTGGARVGTELAAGLRNLFTTKKGLAQLGKMGISNPDQFFHNGQLTNMSPLLGDIASYLNSPALMKSPTARMAAAQNLFGATGGRAFLTLMTPQHPGAQSGLQVYQNELKAMGTPGMAYDKMLSIAQSQASGPGAQWDIMKQRLENLAIVVGNQLIPVLLTFTTWLGNAAVKLREFLGTHKNVIMDVAKAVPALIGGGIASKGVGGVLHYLGKDVKGAGGKVLGTRGGLIAKAAGTLVTDVAAAGARGGRGAVSLLGKGFRGIQAFDQMAQKGQVFPAIGRGLSRAGGAIKAIPGAVVKGVQGVGSGILNLAKGVPAVLAALPGLAGGFLAVLVPVLLVAGAIAIIVLAFLRFRTQTMAAIDIIGKQLNPLFQVLGAIVQTVWAQIQAAWQNAQPAIDAAMQVFLTNLPKITPLLKVLGAIFVVLGAVIGSVLSGIVNGFLNALAPIINFFTGLIDFIGGFFQLLIDLFTLNWGNLGQDLANIGQAIWNMITGIFQAVWNFITGFFQGILNFFGGLVGMFSQKGHDAGKAAADGTAKGINDGTPAVATASTNMTNAFTDPMNHMYHTNTDTFNNLATGGCNAFADLQNCANTHTEAMKKQVSTHVITMKQQLLQTLDDMTTLSAKKLQTIATNVEQMAARIAKALLSLGAQPTFTFPGAPKPGSTFHPPQLPPSSNPVQFPGFASGTSDAPGGWSWVGEDGPELVNLPQHSQVVPRGGRSSGGGMSTYHETRLIQSQRESRYTPQQPIAAGALRSQLDYQYRYMYQYTA